MNRFRTVLAAFAAATTLALAGCGGDDEAAPSGDLPGYVPADAAFYAQAALKPEGETRENAEAFVGNIAPQFADPGPKLIALVNAELASDDAGFTYEEDIEPWLGEDVALFSPTLSGEDGEESWGVIVSTTDGSQAQDFLDKVADQGDEPVETGDYDGVDYKLSPDGQAFAVVDGALVATASEQILQQVVDASGGDSLEDNGDFEELVENAPEDSLGNIYFDAEPLVRQFQAELEEDSQAFFEGLGGAEAGRGLISLVVEANQLEIEVTSTAGGPPAQGSEALLEALPADSVAAFAAPGVGEQLKQLIERIEAQGIPGEIPPGEFKEAFLDVGVDVAAFADIVESVGFYTSGTNPRNLGGAVIIETDDPRGVGPRTLSNIEGVLRRFDVEGVSPLGGQLPGFAIRDPEELGTRPLVVVGRRDAIVIAYGLQAARQAAAARGGQTLAGNPVFRAAADSLQGAEPTGFVDFQGIVRLIETVGRDELDEEEYAEVRPYLEKFAFFVFGADTEGELATARFILGLAR